MAEPLVLLPGMMCDARLFGPQIAELSSEYSIMVSPVTRGERIEEIASGLLDELPARFALAGLSMGGIVAMELLRRAPDRITRVAFMDTSPLAETPQASTAREPQIIKARTGRLQELMRDEVLPTYFGPGPYRAEITELMLDMADALGPEIFVRQSRALQRRRDQQGTLRKCKVPTMVLCGAHDMLCPVKRHTFMAELINGAELRVLEEAGHVPTLEAPAETTQALRDWMQQPLILR
ncbi:MAG: alpha/beta fold hydrolase [Tateyamaria sp.]|uniref:alpha/beta fold hydrolase n=1 Tax=Tateyamaria sp. TaxID=1929288 RepID=UPI00328FC3DE